jgi:hypothetical protein
VLLSHSIRSGSNASYVRTETAVDLRDTQLWVSLDTNYQTINDVSLDTIVLSSSTSGHIRPKSSEAPLVVSCVCKKHQYIHLAPKIQTLTHLPDFNQTTCYFFTYTFANSYKLLRHTITHVTTCYTNLYTFSLTYSHLKKTIQSIILSWSLKHIARILLEPDQLTSQNTKHCSNYVAKTRKNTFESAPPPIGFHCTKSTTHIRCQNSGPFQKLRNNTLCTLPCTYTHFKKPYTKIQSIWIHKLQHSHKTSYYSSLRYFLTTKKMWDYTLQKIQTPPCISPTQHPSNYTSLPADLHYHNHPPTTPSHNHFTPTPQPPKYHNHYLLEIHKIT